MKIPSLSQLQKADPSKTNAWLISALGAVSTFLVSIQPQLNGVTGWQTVAGIVFFAILPHVQGLLTSRDAYKPSTVNSLVREAEARGQQNAKESKPATKRRSTTAKKTSTSKTTVKSATAKTK